MLSSKKIIQFIGCLFILFISGCQHVSKINDYELRKKCLDSIIYHCKASGWNYVTTDPICKRAAAEGIYGLTTWQLESCQLAERKKIRIRH